MDNGDQAAQPQDELHFDPARRASSQYAGGSPTGPATTNNGTSMDPPAVQPLAFAKAGSPISGVKRKPLRPRNMSTDSNQGYDVAQAGSASVSPPPVQHPVVEHPTIPEHQPLEDKPLPQPPVEEAEQRLNVERPVSMQPSIEQPPVVPPPTEQMLKEQREVEQVYSILSPSAEQSPKEQSETTQVYSILSPPEQEQRHAEPSQVVQAIPTLAPAVEHETSHSNMDSLTREVEKSIKDLDVNTTEPPPSAQHPIQRVMQTGAEHTVTVNPQAPVVIRAGTPELQKLNTEGKTPSKPADQTVSYSAVGENPWGGSSSAQEERTPASIPPAQNQPVTIVEEDTQKITQTPQQPGPYYEEGLEVLEGARAISSAPHRRPRRDSVDSEDFIPMGALPLPPDMMFGVTDQISGSLFGPRDTSTLGSNSRNETSTLRHTGADKPAQASQNQQQPSGQQPPPANEERQTSTEAQQTASRTASGFEPRHVNSGLPAYQRPRTEEPPSVKSMPSYMKGAPPRPKAERLPPGWEWYHNVLGEPFFVNRSKGEATRVNPTNIPKPSDLGALPEGWVASETDEGRKFFIDHKHNDRTTWKDPRFNHLFEAYALPPSWDWDVTQGGQLFFINHQAQENTLDDPRPYLIQPSSLEMPLGWGMSESAEGQISFYDSVSQSYTKVPPPPVDPRPDQKPQQMTPINSNISTPAPREYPFTGQATYSEQQTQTHVTSPAQQPHQPAASSMPTALPPIQSPPTDTRSPAPQYDSVMAQTHAGPPPNANEAVVPQYGTQASTTQPPPTSPQGTGEPPPGQYASSITPSYLGFTPTINPATQYVAPLGVSQQSVSSPTTAGQPSPPQQYASPPSIAPTGAGISPPVMQPMLQPSAQNAANHTAYQQSVSSHGRQSISGVSNITQTQEGAQRTSPGAVSQYSGPGQHHSVCCHCEQGISYGWYYERCSFCDLDICFGCSRANRHPEGHQGARSVMEVRNTDPFLFPNRSCGFCQTQGKQLLDCKSCPFSVCANCHAMRRGTVNHSHQGSCLSKYIDPADPRNGIDLAKIGKDGTQNGQCCTNRTIGHCPRCLKPEHETINICLDCPPDLRGHCDECTTWLQGWPGHHNFAHHVKIVLSYLKITSKEFAKRKSEGSIIVCIVCEQPVPAADFPSEKTFNSMKEHLHQNQGHARFICLVDIAALRKIASVSYVSCLRKPIRQDPVPQANKTVMYECGRCRKGTKLKNLFSCVPCVTDPAGIRVCRHCFPYTVGIHEQESGHKPEEFICEADPMMPDDQLKIGWQVKQNHVGRLWYQCVLDPNTGKMSRPTFERERALRGPDDPIPPQSMQGGFKTTSNAPRQNFGPNTAPPYPTQGSPSSPHPSQQQQPGPQPGGLYRAQTGQGQLPPTQQQTYQQQTPPQQHQQQMYQQQQPSQQQIPAPPTFQHASGPPPGSAQGRREGTPMQQSPHAYGTPQQQQPQHAWSPSQVGTHPAGQYPAAMPGQPPMGSRAPTSWMSPGANNGPGPAPSIYPASQYR